MTSETMFAWVYLPKRTDPVVAGRLEISKTASGSVGSFVYGKSYRSMEDAIPIDPVSLPLQEKAMEFTSLNGFPGAILDSCPDRWGIKVIDRLDGKKAHPSGYILMNDPGRSGCLAFSRSADDVPQELSSREFSLAELMDAAESVDAGRPVDDELLKALHPGTGGARPKCNIIEDGAVWIAKFHGVQDDPSISIPRLEHATMLLGAECGIRTAETRLKTVNGKDVCLVRRFDRDIHDGGIYRKGFLSARTVFYADSVYQSIGSGSYARLSRWMARYGCESGQRIELFRRMVFNCAVRNTDDHDLNHGLVHLEHGRFELAPAYDVVPSLVGAHKIHHHALLIGDSSAGTVENLVDVAFAFGLERADAISIIHDIQSTIELQWQEIFYSAGMGDDEIRKMERVFAPIPERFELPSSPSLSPLPPASSSKGF